MNPPPLTTRWEGMTPLFFYTYNMRLDSPLAHRIDLFVAHRFPAGLVMMSMVRRRVLWDFRAYLVLLPSDTDGLPLKSARMSLVNTIILRRRWERAN